MITSLNLMSEFDEEWARILAEAEQRARARGRGDVAEYLTLRQTNDFARTIGSDWLFSTFIEHAGRANRGGASIRIERHDAHRFQLGNSTMVGTLLKFGLGVRSLMVEAGWPRAPRDGIVRGGGLASARIRHFGQPKADEELLLVYVEQNRPRWLVLEKNGSRAPLLEERVHHHVSKLIS
ncbi:MAG TPA: hypothetical protein VJS44_17020 [Pyrinomonadaceae bacterium]|nr:hypothetical protein [Pyrinomonadaceae bacterium]